MIRACRQRKAKCDLGQAGEPPCYKCRREQRDCVFESERQWGAKKRKVASHDSITSDTTSNPKNPASSVAQQSPNQLDSSREDETDTMLRAVVSNGTEALDLLLQGVSQAPRQGQGRTSLSAPRLDREDHTHDDREPPAKSSEILKVWQSTKFVRTGWMTAESAIVYMDL